MNYYDILLAKKLEDDRDPQVVGLSVTENGTYAEEGKVYKPVVVNVEGYKIANVSGLPASIATFPDGSDLPMPKLEVAIEPQQDLHGYDAPWVGGAGYNKWDEEWELGEYNTNTGANYPSSSRIRTKNFVPVLPSTTYYMKCSEGGQICQYDENKTFISGLSTNFSANSSITTSPTTKYIKFSPNGNYGTTYHNDIAVNYPSSITTYSPYSNECPISGWSAVDVAVADDVDNPTTTKTITIQLGDTYYGCKLGVVSGVLTVDMKTVDLSTLLWSTTSLDRQIAILTDAKPAPDNNTKAKIFCDRYPTDTANALISKPTEFLIAINDNKGVMCRTPDGNPPTGQLVYELATPLTIQLTPTAVNSLMGVNNIWADTGDVVDGQYFKSL